MIQNVSSYTNVKPFAWIRELQIILSSDSHGKKIVIGNNEKLNLSISVDIFKYMSTLKDSCTVRIDNLTYSEIIQIVQGDYTNIEIKAGYKNGNIITVFKGGMVYVSNDLGDRKTNTVIILAASDLVARFGKARINLTLNSGINLYSAIKFVCERAGIKNSNVSETLKDHFLQEVLMVNDSPANWLDKLINNNASFISNSDSCTGSTLSIFDISKADSRVINLTSDIIDLAGGFPRVDTSGLSLTVMPTFGFACGDTIKVDSSIINLGVSSTTEAYKNLANYIDKDGYYIIYQLEYHLNNRSAGFSVDILAKSRSKMTTLAGITK